MPRDRRAPDHEAGSAAPVAAAVGGGIVAGLLRDRRRELLVRWEHSLGEDFLANEPRSGLALRGEIVRLVDRIAVELDRLHDHSGESAVLQVEDGKSWLAQEAFADRDVLGALRALSHLRRVLVDLFFAEEVAPRCEECQLICSMIDAAAAAITMALHDAEQQRVMAIRDRFIAILGHDLRNPLNAITIASSALRRHELPERDALLVNRVLHGAERMEKMITDLLEFAAARLIPETFTPAREDALLARICEEAVEEMRLLHPTRAIVLDARDPGAGAWDRNRLLRVFSNLLGNAIAYGDPSSRVSITVSRHHERMLVSVHNAGPPIDPEVVRTIFEPFERGPGIPGKPGGLGLGLFIARQIARAHDGDISVESSAEEKGTTFTLELPIVRRDGSKSDGV